jgi:hypothetical protein
MVVNDVGREVMYDYEVVGFVYGSYGPVCLDCHKMEIKALAVFASEAQEETCIECGERLVS